MRFSIFKLVILVAGISMPAAIFAQANPLARGAERGPNVDLTGLDWLLKRGFNPGDEKGFAAAPKVKQVKGMPVRPNRVFRVPRGPEVNIFTAQARFAANANLRALPRPAFLFKRIGEGWTIYLNGRLLRNELFPDGKGGLERYRYTRTAIVPIPAGLLRESNTLVIRLAGHAPAGVLSNNFQLGLTSSSGSRLGPEDEIREDERRTVDLTLYGVYIFFGLYHLLLFARRRESLYNLYFGAFSVVLAVYLLAFSNRVSHLAEDSAVQVFWAYFSQPAALSLFLLFVHNFLEGKIRPSNIILGFIAANAVIGLLMIILPYRWYQELLFLWYIPAAPQLIYMLYYIARAVHRRLRYAKRIVLGLSLGILFVVWDILDTVFFNTHVRLTRYAHLLIILSLTTILANRFMDIQRQSEELNEELAQQKDAFYRFVPAQLLEYLNQDSIVDIRLGDYTERNMTILVADIRSFSTLSEAMTPEDNFRFLNAYLSRVSPVIRAHDGFIDKYIGDGVMALFRRADDAVAAAVGMRRELERFNAQRAEIGKAQIDIGIGIHSGSLILGTIGEVERMEGTVISDDVNQAFRLESLTKSLSAPIIISIHTLHDMKDPAAINYRFLGKVEVKGRSEQVSIYEVLDGLDEQTRARRLETRYEFERALFEYNQGEYARAAEILTVLAERDPEDRAAASYLEGCKSGATL